MSYHTSAIFVTPDSHLRPSTHDIVVALNIDDEVTVHFGITEDCADAVPAIDHLITALTSLRAAAEEKVAESAEGVAA